MKQLHRIYSALVFTIIIQSNQINSSPSHNELVIQNKKTEQKPFQFSFDRLDLYIQKKIADYVGMDKLYKPQLCDDYPGINASYNSRLYNAICSSNFKNAKILIMFCANIDAPQPNTPLNEVIRQYSKAHWPSYLNYKKDREQAFLIFNCLLSHNVDINNKNGVDLFELQPTPLHCAVDREAIPLLKILIAKGADLNIKNQSNKTPLDCAKIKAMNTSNDPDSRKKYYEICKILENAGTESSIQLNPMPTDEIMSNQFRLAMRGVPTCKTCRDMETEIRIFS